MRTSLILTLTAFCAICCAQQPKEIRMAAIPFPMKWDNQPLTYSTSDRDIVITAGPKTDIFTDPHATYKTDNAPKLLFTPDEDFVLTAGIRHAFASKWDGGALMLFADSANWVKFCFEKDYTGAHRIVTVVTRSISDDSNSLAINGDIAWFKLAKAGPAIMLYVSTDQKSWLLVRHCQMPVMGTLKAGFLAQSPTGESCKVTFSDIRYEKRKIQDPYQP